MTAMKAKKTIEVPVQLLHDPKQVFTKFLNLFNFCKFFRRRCHCPAFGAHRTRQKSPRRTYAAPATSSACRCFERVSGGGAELKIFHFSIFESWRGGKNYGKVWLQARQWVG